MAKDINIFLLDLYPSNGLCETLRRIFASSSHMQIESQAESAESLDTFSSNNRLADAVSQCNPDLLCLIMSPHHLGQADSIFKFLKEDNPALPVIAVIENCKPDEAVLLLKSGAADFILPPLRAVDVLPRVWRLIQHTQRSDSLTHRLKEKLGLKQMVGETPAFLNEVKKIPLMAKCDSTTLISGETGTGKELFARAIHYLSPRAGSAFMPVNCGAIPLELIENELFGHVRGAFSGAATSYSGLINDADGGTLFLDEIDCLPLNAQVKFLRFLQDKVYRQLGSSKIHRADIRVIAAANVNLQEAVREGRFRHDLFYRLNIIPANLPPLRQRTEDIMLLARHFLEKYSTELHKEITGFAPETVQKLLSYHWPGNIRELENVIERAVVFNVNNVIQGRDLSLPDYERGAEIESFQQAKARVVNRFEERYIKELLLAHSGNITKASRAAKKNRRAFWELIRKHNIDTQNFRSPRLQ